MKLLFCLFSITLTLNLCAQNYLFVASYRTNGEGCKDRLLKQVPLETRQPYDSLFRNFYRDNNANAADRWLLRPNEPAIVYEFRTKIQGFSCEYLAHAMVNGKTLEEAEDKMNHYAANNPKVYLSNPNVVVRWSGTPNKKQIEKEGGKAIYGGLEVTYNHLPNGSVLAKGNNTNEDVKVVITYLTKSGSTISELEVVPGGSFNYTINESMFDVQVLFKPGTKTNSGTIQKLKQNIKGSVESNSQGEIINTVTGSRQ